MTDLRTRFRGSHLSRHFCGILFTPFHQDFWRGAFCFAIYIYIYIPIISAAHLVYHDVLAEILSAESWSARLWAIKWCWVGQWAWRCLNIANMCLLLVANVTRSQQPHPSYRKRKSQTIISQDFLVSVGLAKWGLTRLGSPSICVFSGSNLALSLQC